MTILLALVAFTGLAFGTLIKNPLLFLVGFFASLGLALTNDDQYLQIAFGLLALVNAMGVFRMMMKGRVGQ